MANNDISRADARKENVSLALGVFWRTVVAGFLCLFLYMSITILITGLTTHKVGYQIYEKTESGSAVLVEEIDTIPSEEELAEIEEKLEENQVLQPKMSKVPAAASAAMDIISQIFMLVLLIAFPYTLLWGKGDRDKNTVNFGHMEEDKLRGLKVGLMAAIPSGVAYLILLICRLLHTGTVYFACYRFFNTPFMPIYNRLTQGVETIGDVSWAAMLVFFFFLAVVPLICHVSYMLGYTQISISEKLIYVNSDKKKRR